MVVQTAQECSINIVMLAQLRIVNAGSQADYERAVKRDALFRSEFCSARVRVDTSRMLAEV